MFKMFKKTLPFEFRNLFEFLEPFEPFEPFEPLN